MNDSTLPPPSFRRTLHHLKYIFLGPSIAHLRYELYLWVSLQLLLVGSLTSLHKDQFGTRSGDWVFLFVVALFTGRHIVFRVISTWDYSSHASPSILGLVSHFLQTYIYRDHTFDRPSAIRRVNFSERAGNSATQPLEFEMSANDRMQILTGGSALPDIKYVSTAAQVAPSILVYALEIPNQYVWLPLFRRYGRKYRSPSSLMTPWMRSTWTLFLQSSHETYVSYGISPRVVLNCIILLVCCYQIYKGFQQSGTYGLRPTVSPQRSELTIELNTSKGVIHDAPGEYWKRVNTSNFDHLIFWFAASSLGAFAVSSQLLLPLPDFVAGRNVIADVRNYAQQATNAVWKKVDATVSFVKRYGFSVLSAAGEDGRLGIWFFVGLARFCENALVVALLPRMYAVCLTTGHCRSGISFWELSRFLFPAGHATARRTDLIGESYQDQEQDFISTLFVVGGVAIVTTFLLCAQSTVSNRMYLSLESHLYHDWKRVQAKTGKPITNAESSMSVEWIDGETYMKGDRVYLTGNSKVEFEAAINNPSGPPRESALHQYGKTYQNELSHPGTSVLITRLVGLQWTVVVAHIVFLGTLMFFGASNVIYGHFWFCAAHLVAFSALLSWVMTPGGQRASFVQELRKLNAEI